MKEIYIKWQNNWEWILSIAKKRKWSFLDLTIMPPISLGDFNILENKLKVYFPVEFKNTLTNFSAAVRFGWQISDEDDARKLIKNVFSGCGGYTEYKKDPYVWDFYKLEEIYSNYKGWIEFCYSDPHDSYGKHYYNKIPFIEVPNGVLIVFDYQGHVIYLSHDDGPLHGHKLADNFIEFITLWSALGSVGTESEQFVPFYDLENNKLTSRGKIIDDWKKWLDTI
jgi:hypothetical protein